MTIRWSLDEIGPLIVGLRAELVPLGWDVGLTGGVLYKGASNKDLDIILYPRKKDKTWWARQQLCIEGARRGLRRSGWVFSRQMLYGYSAQDEHNDHKYVEEWRTPDNRRVDVFFLS